MISNIKNKSILAIYGILSNGIFFYFIFKIMIEGIIEIFIFSYFNYRSRNFDSIGEVLGIS